MSCQPAAVTQLRVLATGQRHHRLFWYAFTVAVPTNALLSTRFVSTSLQFAHETGLDLMVAAVDGGSHSYWHARSSGDDSLGEVMRVLLPMLKRRVGDLPVFVMGWSMGGYGALLAALEYPAAFAGVIVSSAALWNKFSESAAGAFDSEADFAAHDVLGRIGSLRGLRVRIDCGADDPFEKPNRRLLALVPNVEGGIRPGFHDSKFWRSVVHEQLEFLKRTITFG